MDGTTFHTIFKTFSGVKITAVVICVFVFISPVCVNCAIYFILCYSSVAKAKRNFEENLEPKKCFEENEDKSSEHQNNEVSVIDDGRPSCVIVNDTVEVLANVSTSNSNANYISSEVSTSPRTTPNDNNWEEILNAGLDSNLPKARSPASAEQPSQVSASAMLKPTLSTILRTESENSEMHQTKQEISLAMKSLQTNLALISLVLILSVLYLVPSTKWQSYFTAINESLQKGLLPTITTIANFGTVRSVLLKYWQFSRNRIHPRWIRYSWKDLFCLIWTKVLSFASVFSNDFVDKLIYFNDYTTVIKPKTCLRSRFFSFSEHIPHQPFTKYNFVKVAKILNMSINKHRSRWWLNYNYLWESIKTAVNVMTKCRVFLFPNKICS